MNRHILYRKAAVFSLTAVMALFCSSCGSGSGAAEDSDNMTSVTRTEELGEETDSHAMKETEDALKNQFRNESEGIGDMEKYDFSDFPNVELIGAEPSDFDEEQLSVLYQQARYCQAMTEADIETMEEIVSEDMTFTHMSGRQQTREEYFADVEDGGLRYFSIGIENPVVEVDGNTASITYTSVLNANAYGARGTYRMSGTHWYEMRGGEWIAVNAPK